MGLHNWRIYQGLVIVIGQCTPCRWSCYNKAILPYFCLPKPDRPKYILDSLTLQTTKTNKLYLSIVNKSCLHTYTHRLRSFSYIKTCGVIYHYVYTIDLCMVYACHAMNIQHVCFISFTVNGSRWFVMMAAAAVKKMKSWKICAQIFTHPFSPQV